MFKKTLVFIKQEEMLHLLGTERIWIFQYVGFVDKKKGYREYQLKLNDKAFLEM